MTENIARQPKGTPVGGRFAATTHAEPDLTIVPVRTGPAPRELTREEKIITAQAVEGNPALSEMTRITYHARRKLAQAIKEMDETMLNAAIVQVRQRFPEARELRMRQRGIAGEQRMHPTFLRIGEDRFVGANYDKGPDGDWAKRTVDGADPGSVAEALGAITSHSAVWNTDARCDYDPQTEEHIIYLDGRRRQEH